MAKKNHQYRRIEYRVADPARRQLILNIAHHSIVLTIAAAKALTIPQPFRR
jgi:hypothetical protein